MREKPVSELEKILREYPTLLWHHCPDSRGCEGAPGMPDFIVVSRTGAIIAREVKPHAGEIIHGGQMEWRYAMIAAGISCNTWIPDDIASGRVRQELDAMTDIGRFT